MTLRQLDIQWTRVDQSVITIPVSAQCGVVLYFVVSMLYTDKEHKPYSYKYFRQFLPLNATGVSYLVASEF